VKALLDRRATRAVVLAILVLGPLFLAAQRSARCDPSRACHDDGPFAADAAPGPRPATAERSWARGFNFTNWTPDGYATPAAAASLAEMRATGADTVALIPTWYQAYRDSTAIAPDPEKSPTDASLTIAVALAHANGLKVFLRPLVDAVGPVSRTDFDPRSPDAWFASYERFIDHYAILAQRLGADTLSVGAELTSLDGPQYDAQWRRIIAGVRRRFHGALTYSANTRAAWDHVRFWDALDAIGVDAYFPLARGTPSTADLVARWGASYVPPMAALAARYGKRVLLTELGYPSATTASWTPWESRGGYSATAQQRGLDAALRAFTSQPWFGGAMVWDWSVDPRAGGAGDTDYTPQHKPAQATLEHWFGGPRPALRRRVRLTDVSLHEGRVTVRGTVSGDPGPDVSLAYCGSGAPVVLLRGSSPVEGGRFAAQFVLPRAERSIARVRRAALVVGAPGAPVGARRLTLKGARAR
jgi:hypothetical protein